MNAGTLTGEVLVPFAGAMLCIAPAVPRPTVPFGVRVPAERARATVIRRERYAYFWRTAAIGVCCTVAALLHRWRRSLPRPARPPDRRVRRARGGQVGRLGVRHGGRPAVDHRFVDRADADRLPLPPEHRSRRPRGLDADHRRHRGCASWAGRHQRRRRPVTQVAEDGRFEIQREVGYVAGIATYVLAGELALGRVLAGELPRPAFPPKLRETAPVAWFRLAAGRCTSPRFTPGVGTGSPAWPTWARPYWLRLRAAWPPPANGYSTKSGLPNGPACVPSRTGSRNATRTFLR
jgi:hypothetical protein